MPNSPPKSSRPTQAAKITRRTLSGRVVSLSRDDEDVSGEFAGQNDYINYTVMMPPTPDNQPGTSEYSKQDGVGSYGTTRFASESQQGTNSGGGGGGDGDPKMDRRMSVNSSNNKSMLLRTQTQEFDHNRWLFETKGTYGIGNAFWQDEQNSFGDDGVSMSDFMDKPWKPLTRKVQIPGSILSPYRVLIAIRLVVLAFFLSWRIRNPNYDAMWLWGISIVCEMWFAFSWVLDVLPKLNPINRSTDLVALHDKFDQPSPSNPTGRSDLPGIDVFVSTADPEKEPPLVTANTILSILGAEYPIEKISCYISDDGGAILTFEAMAEAVKFAEAFLKAWQAMCGSDGHVKSTLLIPTEKTFMLQPVDFKGPCKSASINVQLQGNITAPESVKAWKFASDSKGKAWITFSDINGLIVDGGGQIDANGAPFWEETKLSERPTALKFVGCDKLILRNLTHIDSPKNHISIASCNEVLISNINIIAPETSPNTDGIDISRSSNINIQNSNIQTGDDCVAINNGSTIIKITNVFCGPGHGISVGSLGKDQTYETAKDIIVRNCTFTKTQNGARIKTWKGGSGYARNITFDDLIFDGVKNAIVINQEYSDGLTSASAVKVSNVTFSNVRGTSSKNNAIQIACDGIGGGCTDIKFDNINIECTCGDKTITTCKNVKGTSSSCNPPIPCFS